MTVWLGPLVGAVGLISYFAVAARYPALRDVPWLNLPMAALGVGLSCHALWRRRSLWTIGGLALSAACAALLAGYVFVLSSWLPAGDRVVRVGAPAPRFALPDHEGRLVRLEEFSGRPLVVVFYRGFW
jgi:hypothetical protein